MTAYGKGFEPNSLVRVSAGAEGGDELGGIVDVTTGPDGGFTAMLGKLPAALGCGTDAAPSSGARFVIRAETAGDRGGAAAGPAAEAAFTYLGETRATLTLSPSVGMCATEITATGANFTPGVTLTVYANAIGGHQPTLIAEGVSVAADGSFSVALDRDAMLGCAGQSGAAEQVYTVTAGPDIVGKVESETDGRAAGTLFFAASDVPPAVVNRPALPFCGAELAPDGQFVGPNDAARACLRDAFEQGGAGEMVTRALAAGGETITIIRVNAGQPVDVFIATRADQATTFAWTRASCAGVDVTGQQVGVSGCSEPEPLP